MKKHKIAALLLIIHGGLMEIGGCLCLIPLLLFAGDGFDTGHYFSFIVPYFQQNLPYMLAVGGIWGVLRIVGAVGLWKNRMWGFVLSLINCAITLALMAFMLPAGILDGLLAGSALTLLLIAHYGQQPFTA